MIAPLPKEDNSGSFNITCYKNKILNHFYIFEGVYTDLVVLPGFNDLSSSCKTLTSIYVGKYANIECTLEVDLVNVNVPITSIRIKFQNQTGTDTQLAIVYQACEAFVKKTGTSDFVAPPQGQLTCSRQDIDSISPVLLVTGFEVDPLFKIGIKFRARIEQFTALDVDVFLETFDKNNDFVPVMQREGYQININSYIDYYSKKIFSLLIFFSQCSGTF